MDNSAAQAPAITLVNDLLHKAIMLGASDVHLESYSDRLHIRLRIDGLLGDQASVVSDYMGQVLARIKVLARLDIAEKRLPQDGKFTFDYAPQSIDCRVSTFPGLWGEKMVVRILDRSRNMLDVHYLGIDTAMLDTLKLLIRKAHGFFLVTGPTGAGKTTTLYALLSLLRSTEKNIVTLEDPIEYTLDGITQGQVLPEIGFTFASGIRSLVRQDPDIIMVGEIRDKDTAQVAIQAALTGHMVVSTLHTTDAPSTLVRLLDMGVEPFLLNAALTGILNQRLARQLCVKCRVKSALQPHEQRLIAQHKLLIEQSYTSVGCTACRGSGHKGRTGLFELLVISPALRELLSQKVSFDALYQQALADHMVPLMYDAAQKVNQGLISIAELARVLL